MKAGTSWLYMQLHDHPGLADIPIKESHYFFEVGARRGLLNRRQRLIRAKGVLNGMSVDEDGPALNSKLDWCKLYLDDPIDDVWYANLFLDRYRKKHCADYCNLNSYLDPGGWAHVRTVAENIRIIYTLRNPAKRLWSHTKYHAQFLGIKEHLSDWSNDSFRTFLTRPDMIAAAAYSVSISRMRDVLNATEYKICYFEDFQSDPVSELRKLEAFLEIPAKAYDPNALKEVHNRSAAIPAPASFLAASEDLVADELAALDRLGIAIPSGWASSANP